MTVPTVPTAPAGTADVARYAAEVRVALADLPPAAREELLEDLEGHLLEVQADADGPLALRLGTPQAYAAELRASAGLPAPARERRGPVAWLRADVQRLRAAALAAPGGQAVADFLPELRPGWWVLRGWLAVWVLVMLLDTDPTWSAFPVPTIGDPVFGLVAVAAAVVVSVRIGRGGLAVPQRAVVAADLALVVAALVVVSGVQSRFTVVSAYAGQSGPVAPGVLTAADGRSISNLYAFDHLGRPLRDVQLYDQDGQPVDTLALAAPDGSYAEPQYRLDASGNPRGNVFPRQLTSEVWTDSGPSPAPVPPPAVVPPRLAEPAPSPTPRRPRRRRRAPAERLGGWAGAAAPSRPTVIRPGSGHPTDRATPRTPVARSADDVVRLAAAARSLEQVDARSSVCRACPRLVAWREEVALTKRASFAGEEYWGRPITGWGPRDARIAVVGLAPAAHGGNRTGRIFTGDRSGDWLFASLHRCGLATSPTSTSAYDDQSLVGLRITLPVRCAPPANKPTPAERDACAPWLSAEWRLLQPTVRAVVVLGGYGWAALWPTLRGAGEDVPAPLPRFAHGAEVVLPSGLAVLGCFHVSQQNTFTGRLTEPMLDAVFARAKQLAGVA